MTYESHNFFYERNSQQPSNPINVTGFLITESGYENGEYNGHNFVDTSKEELIVEVAGGLCNIPLGKSTIEVAFDAFPDCAWNLYLPKESGYKKIFKDIPAQ